MTERPILMSGAMVRAILAGTKTQTRRIIKPQPDEHIDRLHGDAFRTRAPYDLRCPETDAPNGFGFEDEHRVWRSTYGKPGDRLWVRETWSQDATSMYPCPQAWYRASDDLVSDGVHSCPKQHRGNYADCLACWEGKHDKFRWRPSIHMRRELSRITLEVVSVRVERLRGISEADAMAEGVENTPNGRWKHYASSMGSCCDASGSFRSLWESINGKGSWDANPWVWVVEFKRVTG